MAGIEDLQIATWNAALTFDPAKSAERIEAGFCAIEAMGAHVLNIPETSSRGAGGELIPADHWSMLQSNMKDLGYTQGIHTGGVRTDLVTSMWSREEGEMGLVSLGKERYLMRLRVPGVGRFFGMHAPSDSEIERADIATAFVDYLKKGEMSEAEAADEGIALIEDSNTADAKDSITTGALHAIDPVVRHIPGVANMDHFNGSRLKVKFGLGVRACAMTRGTSLKILRDTGFTDVAGDNHEPTVHAGGLALRIDRMLTWNMDLTDYRVIPRALDMAGNPISDHNAIMATAAKR